MTPGGLSSTEESLRLFLQEANEPRDKALIIVLMDINRNMQRTVEDLAKNTELTGKIETEVLANRTAFLEHLVDEQKLFSQGKGMYRGLTAAVALIGLLFTTIMGMGAYIGNLHVGRLDDAVKTAVRNDGRISVLENQVLRINEDRFKGTK